MTLNTNEPTDSRMVSELPTYIRETRTAVNAIVGSDNFGVTALSVPAGTASLSIGSELSSDGIEVVIVTGAGLSDIATILGGTEGQVKVFIFQDSNVDIADGNAKINGVFYLNHLPAGSDFEPEQDDILVVVNIGGDGAAVYGYWKELFRSLSVK
jgi:hypothetical protein